MTESLNNEHDVGYKYLFGNKRVFLQLLNTFVKRDWVKELDELHLQKVEKSFILQDFNEKEADIIYELKTEEQDVYFYILLELQSSVDYSMPFRLLQYMYELWRDIIKNTDQREFKSKKFKLPVIVPIVLYNGQNKWTAPLAFKDYFHQGHLFGKQVLNFEYILLDINRMGQDQLLSNNNLISSIFYLDRTVKSEEEIFRRLYTISPVLEHIPQEDFLVFKNWVKHILINRFPREQSEEIISIIENSNQREVSFMISGLEQSYRKNTENAVAVVKLLLEGKTVKEISEKLNLPQEKVTEIKEIFESINKLN
jgi:predicted transposase YdaD